VRLLGAAFVAQCGFSVIDQGLPTLTGFMKSDLRLSAFGAGLLVAMFGFGKCLSSYSAGAAADRFGERRVVVVGGLATGAAVALAAAVPLAAVYAFFAIAGVAASVATPGGGKLVMTAFPPHRRALALGIRQAAVPVGGMVGAAILPAFAGVAGWTWSLVLGGAAAVVGVLPLLLVRRRHHDERPPTGSLADASVLNRNIVLITIWGAVFVSGQFALLAFVALDLHQRAGLSLAAGSLFVVVAQAGGLAGRIGWGFLSDRLLDRGRKPLLLAVSAVALPSILLLALVPASTPVLVLVPVVTIAGVGVIGFQGLWVTLIVESAHPARVGAATGAATAGLLATAAVSTPLYGLAADVSGSYRAIWFVLAAALVCALVPALTLHEPEKVS
jgi:MFS family permease